MSTLIHAVIAKLAVDSRHHVYPSAALHWKKVKSWAWLINDEEATEAEICENCFSTTCRCKEKPATCCQIAG